MSGIKERRAIQPLSPQTSKPKSPEERRTSIWIRPTDVRNILVELRALAYYYLSPPRLPKWKGILRFGVDLLGIAIVLSFISFLVTQALINSTLINAQSAPLTTGCIAIQGCDKAAATPKATPSQPASQGSPIAILTPLLPPTPRPVQLSPTPGPSLSPTPSTAVLSVVPSSLTVSYSHVCAIKAPVLLVLKNVGGAPLLWSQDKNNTSPGIHIVDPTKAYLLQQGQSVTANAFCSPGNNGSHYKLEILYNGGEVTIPVMVTE
jgi:hypothetical protein